MRKVDNISWVRRRDARRLGAGVREPVLSPAEFRRGNGYQRK
jgi:hypothetical protein